MATVDNCIYKSVTLAEGEQFNLPPGAVLVASTNVSAITSTCPIPQLEELQCYGFILPSGEWGGSTATFDPSGIFWRGLEINGVYYPFASPVQQYDNDGVGPVPPINIATFQTSIKNAIQALPIGSVFINFVIDGTKFDEYDSSLTTYVIFQTIPSIANATKLVGTTDVGLSSPNFGKAEFLMPCLTRDEIVAGTPVPALGIANVQACPTT